MIEYNLQGEDSEAALVTFESDDAAGTALLLSNSLLDDRPIFVVNASSVGETVCPRATCTVSVGKYVYAASLHTMQ